MAEVARGGLKPCSAAATTAVVSGARGGGGAAVKPWAAGAPGPLSRLGDGDVDLRRTSSHADPLQLVCETIYVGGLGRAHAVVLVMLQRLMPLPHRVALPVLLHPRVNVRQSGVHKLFRGDCPSSCPGTDPQRATTRVCFGQPATVCSLTLQ